MPAIAEAVEYRIGVPVWMLMTWVTVVVLVVLSLVGTRRPTVVPGGLQTAFEVAFEFIDEMVETIIGREGRAYYPLFLGLFLFIFVGNLLGLIPGLVSPTANLNTTIALALIVFVSTHALGIKQQGLLRYLAHFTHGVPGWLKPFMFIIEVIGEIARPISLSFRLFGNIMAKEILLAILALLVVLFLTGSGALVKALTVVPLLLRPLIILLGMLLGLIQAFIFTVLSIFYIGGAIQMHRERSPS